MKRLFSTLALCSLLLTACNSTPTETTAETENPLCSEPLSVNPDIPEGDVLSLAQTQTDSAEAYNFTEESGAEIIPVDNNNSYAVWWEPTDFDPTQDTVVVSLHGHASWAVRDFEAWYPELTQRNVAYLGLQWWFGRSLEDEGYYEPDQVYALIAEQLAAKGIPSGHVIFEGFSMGSARSYGVTLYDHLCGENYFAVSIANSGPWEDEYALYKKVLTKAYGSRPFEGTHWILFCGEQDPKEKPGTVCDSMAMTQDRLENMGGTIDLFIKDSTGGHGSFMLNLDNVNEAIEKATASITPAS